MRVSRRCEIIMALFVLALMLCPLMAQDKEIKVAPQVLKPYVGVYQLAPNFTISITLEGEQLSAQASGQGKAPIYPSSETKFFYKVVNAQIEFFKDNKGSISHLVLYQNGQEIKGPRISGAVSERKEIKVAPSVLSRYVGTYELQPGVNVAFTLEGDQLMTQITGQPKFPLFAESETKFFLKVVDAQVEFIRNDKGEVTHAVLHQGPSDIKAPRK